MKFPNTAATLHTLDNGLRVILDPDSSAPVISTQIWVSTGSIHEGGFMGAGISHLLEHMVFKGTKSFSGEELSQTVQAAGGQWNAYTTFDRTVYYIDGPANSAETFLKSLTEMVFLPTFPEDEYEKEKDVIRREIDMGLDDADNAASRLLFSTALADDGRSQPVIGHLELFNLITHADMVGYHHDRYTTENAFISISGDFETEEMLETLGALTKDIKRSFTKPASPACEPAQLGQRKASDTFSIPATKLNMAWQTVGLSHPDSAALDLLSSILGGGRSSRLYQSIREEQNLCHHIGSWSWVTQQSPGLFCVSVEADTEQIPALQKAIHDEVKSLSLTKLGLDAELSKAKRMCLSSQFATLTTASGRASDLASNWHETRNLNFTSDYLKHINQITAEDIRRVCTQYLLDDSILTVTTLDPLTEKKLTSSAAKKSTERDITSHTLSNGLTLLLCPDHRTPTVSIQSAIRAGMPSETPESAGVSTLLSTLLRKGTATRSGEEIAITLDSLGAGLGASGGNNTSLVSASCLTPDLDVVLELFADTFSAPALHQENIDHERHTQLTALKEQDEEPVSLALRTLKESLYSNSGYGINRLGTEKSLTDITRPDLEAHHALLYNGSNSAVAIFGDIDTDNIIDLAEKHLSAIPAGEKFSYPEQKIAQGTETNLTLDKQQAILTLGYQGTAVGDKHQHALDLIHAWCADMAGPLFTRIREELGLAYYCSATQFHGTNTGFFGFYLGTSPEQLDLARTELVNTIDDIAGSGISETMLKNVKTSWLAKQALANQSNGTMAQLCAIDTALGLSPLHHRQTAEQIKAVTTTEIKAAAEHFFGNAKPTIVTVRP
ncbi:MAG: zinc protease [Cryomorphaceae bacterium]|jgi:zinc protease